MWSKTQQRKSEKFVEGCRKNYVNGQKSTFHFLGGNRAVEKVVENVENSNESTKFSESPPGLPFASSNFLPENPTSPVAIYECYGNKREERIFILFC